MVKIGKSFTAVVVARNERERLPLVLKRFACLENVLVVDNFSTDDTRDIVAAFGRECIQVHNQGGFVETADWMEVVTRAIKTPYFLLAACAEDVPLSLLNKYDEVSLLGNYDIVLTQRVSITAGLPIPIDLPPRWLGWRYKGEVRFFRLGAVDYTDNLVHGRGRIVCDKSRVLRLPRVDTLCFYQYRDYDSSETESKHCNYNDTLALQRYGAGSGGGIFMGILRATKRFLVVYFIYGAFRFGWLGFIHSYYRFHMELGIAFRCWEHRCSMTKKDIQQLHLEIRMREPGI